ncbi:alpha/beta hydrolase [Sediminibacterium sp.]|uniref:alpha/beta hydrolase n=1 Tax=Sediminibacterium sp. TaxID=1917865 RepID=UPI0027334926|nr:alpha/beta hydrolase [Sediminibacterium sp.]MDP3394607.1 alpha/beta hydrolase [Sediminibacterium sp.]MDP3568442.1 alpha/beta hydrolase [Sediminibacterium sp.]
MVNNKREEILLFPDADSSQLGQSPDETVFFINGVKCISGLFTPKLEVFVPAQKANELSIIICPGGGYEKLAIDLEGNEVAEKLNEWGITVFVLKYRLPHGEIANSKIPLPLIDIKKAFSVVQERANDWGLNPSCIGLMGFSAGGHLASIASSILSSVNNGMNDLKLLPPLFSILIYPVISFSNEITHLGSRNRFIGLNPSVELIQQYSAECLVHPLSPPVFLVHCSDDKDVSVENSIAYHKAYINNGVSAEMHIYHRGGHGFGMLNTLVDESWMDHLQKWLLQFSSIATKF